MNLCDVFSAIQNLPSWGGGWGADMSGFTAQLTSVLRRASLTGETRTRSEEGYGAAVQSPGDFEASVSSPPQGEVRTRSAESPSATRDLQALLEEVFGTYAVVSRTTSTSSSPFFGAVHKALTADAWRLMMEECRIVDAKVSTILLEQLFRDAGGGQPVRFSVFMTIIKGVADEKFGGQDALDKLAFFHLLPHGRKRHLRLPPQSQRSNDPSATLGDESPGMQPISPRVLAQDTESAAHRSPSRRESLAGSHGTAPDAGAGRDAPRHLRSPGAAGTLRVPRLSMIQQVSPRRELMPPSPRTPREPSATPRSASGARPPATPRDRVLGEDAAAALLRIQEEERAALDALATDMAARRVAFAQERARVEEELEAQAQERLAAVGAHEAVQRGAVRSGRLTIDLQNRLRALERTARTLGGAAAQERQKLEQQLLAAVAAEKQQQASVAQAQKRAAESRLRKEVRAARARLADETLVQDAAIAAEMEQEFERLRLKFEAKRAHVCEGDVSRQLGQSTHDVRDEAGRPPAAPGSGAQPTSPRKTQRAKCSLGPLDEGKLAAAAADGGRRAAAGGASEELRELLMQARPAHPLSGAATAAAARRGG